MNDPIKSDSPEGAVDLPRFVRRGPWDGPVTPPKRWKKMRGVRKGFRKWTDGESWVTHEQGQNGCHLGRRGEETRFITQSPKGIMMWVDSFFEPNTEASRDEGGEKS